MLKTIIISGKSGAGKDMFASFMKQELEAQNKRVIIIHYADALKWILRDYFGWNGIKDENGRQLLQTVGTDMVRNVVPDYWTAVVGGLLKAFEPFDVFDVALVPDARFENEIEILMNILEDVTTVRIERKNADGTDWVNPSLTEEQKNHPSEISLDKYVFDYIVHNDEGLATLKESAEAVLIDIGAINETKRNDS